MMRAKATLAALGESREKPSQTSGKMTHTSVSYTHLAQAYAQGFYERLGFVRTSDEFDDGGIMHVEMKLAR